MSGEHAGFPSVAYQPTGSSPHVRGARPRASWSWTRTWDHPRMCGEHAYIPFEALALQGSSPHVRGARDATDAGQHLAGIIPACAGSTGTHTRLQGGCRDHPRMCGEHQTFAYNAGPSPESSPHVRGALPSLGTTQTPARDHPRTCGEHRQIQSQTSTPTGSSPHVRGALCKAQHEEQYLGIIPACAGSTKRRCRR